MGRLAEHGEDHRPGDAGLLPIGPGGDRGEAEVLPHVASPAPVRSGQGLGLVGPADGHRRLTVGEEVDRTVPLVADGGGGQAALGDQPAEEAQRLGRPAEPRPMPSSSSTLAPLEARNPIRQ